MRASGVGVTACMKKSLAKISGCAREIPGARPGILGLAVVVDVTMEARYARPRELGLRPGTPKFSIAVFGGLKLATCTVAKAQVAIVVPSRVHCARAPN